MFVQRKKVISSPSLDQTIFIWIYLDEGEFPYETHDSGSCHGEMKKMIAEPCRTELKEQHEQQCQRKTSLNLEQRNMQTKLNV